MTNEVVKLVSALKLGKIILYPTDTIWGLGCDVLNEAAIERIYSLKNRPKEKSMIILVDSIGMLNRYFRNIPDAVYDIVENTDDPITFILDNPVNVHPSLINADGSIGVRVTQNKFNQQLIHRFGKAIVSTSANRSGDPSPVNYSSINKTILDGVDEIADPIYEKSSTGKASRIIKIKPNGEFKFLR